MRKPLVRWGLVALVLLLVAAGAMRALSARMERSSAELASAKVEAVVELAPTDVVRADSVDLSQVLPLSGSLRAVNSAVVKARVRQEAQLTIEGMATPVVARVVRINPSAQAGSRSVLAYLPIANAAGLRQVLFARAGWRPAVHRRWRCRYRRCAPTSRRPMSSWSRMARCCTAR